MLIIILPHPHPTHKCIASTRHDDKKCSKEVNNAQKNFIHHREKERERTWHNCRNLKPNEA